MATEAKDNKKLILGIVGAVAAIAVIVVVAVVILKNKKPVLNDDYFKSDGSKLVISIDGNASENGLIKQHQVYTYSGETITGFKSYAEFDSADSAKKVYDNYKSSSEFSSEFKDIELDGKYVILTVPEEQYKDLTTSTIKSYIELLESVKNADLESTTDEGTGEGEESVENGTTTTENEE